MLKAGALWLSLCQKTNSKIVRLVFLKPNFYKTLKNASQKSTKHIRKVISTGKVAGFRTEN